MRPVFLIPMLMYNEYAADVADAVERIDNGE
jgi:hypothetical protein